MPDLSMIAGLPALIALVVCFKRGPAYAFLNLYLPLLMLLPDDCRMPVSGQLNFSESALIIIAAFYIWDHWQGWEWSITDILVLVFATLVSVSEYENTDYWLAQHLAQRMVVTLVLPYMVAKGLIVQEQMSAQIAKRIAVLAAFVAIVSVYEFRMTLNPFTHLMSNVFPTLRSDATFRSGYARVRGPWDHPILAGMIFALAYRLVRFLDWTDNWPGNLPFLPISKARFCEGLLLLGSALTISRGPWLAASIAAAIIMLLRSPLRAYLSLLTLFIVLIASLPIYYGFISYISASPTDSGDEMQASAAYRLQLIEQYVTIAEERPDWGWGSNESGEGLYPEVSGMSSVDNHYLVVALRSGMYALTLLVLLLLCAPARLLGFGLRRARSASGTYLAFTLIGVMVLLSGAILTVWLGAQTQPLLFIVIGWGEGLLAVEVQEPSQKIGYRFERVMV